MYSWQPERKAWQSAVHLRAVCQGVIPVVAIRGIWLRSLANEWIPVPAILHWQFPCLLHHKFLTHDFLGVRHIRGGLFRPKLYTNTRTDGVPALYPRVLPHLLLLIHQQDCLRYEHTSTSIRYSIPVPVLWAQLSGRLTLRVKPGKLSDTEVGVAAIPSHMCGWTPLVSTVIWARSWSGS
jgi:hypothetical protein